MLAFGPNREKYTPMFWAVKNYESKLQRIWANESAITLFLHSENLTSPHQRRFSNSYYADQCMGHVLVSQSVVRDISHGMSGARATAPSKIAEIFHIKCSNNFANIFITSFSSDTCFSCSMHFYYALYALHKIISQQNYRVSPSEVEYSPIIFHNLRG